MVRNIVIFGGSSHPSLTKQICDTLGIPEGNVNLAKFAVGETRVEIHESVRGKDVYIIQSGGGRVNDNLMELLITISACKTASAKKVTAVMPLFPYSRQSDIPYNKVGAPLSKAPTKESGYTFESRPESPKPSHAPEGPWPHASADSLQKRLAHLHTSEKADGEQVSRPKRSDTASTTGSTTSNGNGVPRGANGILTAAEQETATAASAAKPPAFTPQRGYRQWVAQAGTLIADLLMCAGADHVITMDLHDPQYQGFFDIPVDNLYGRHLLRKYIERNMPAYQSAVIVSPDAGGAKRATNIADALGMPFALIHKERRPAPVTDRSAASMILVGNVEGRTAILIDDLVDTANTLTRAAKLLKKEGASSICALVTHGVLSGDAIERINQSALDKIVVTNSVDQEAHCRRCPKLEVLQVGEVFAEAIRRVHHGESISVLFQHD